MDAILLRCADSAAAILPASGAAIQYWSWQGRDVLRPASPDAEIADMGCFPLVPYANRIGHGRLPNDTQLPAHPGEPHSLHGIGWRRAWEVCRAGSDSARLALRHTSDASWPFAFEATLDIGVRADALEQVLVVRNIGHLAMPAGAGFHPYFAIDGTTRLSAGWQGRWETGADLLPVMHRPVAAARETPANTLVVNHCHTAWNRNAVLDFGGHRVVLTANEPCTYLHCYRPDIDSAFIALEPVSHVPNAHQLLRAGHADLG